MTPRCVTLPNPWLSCSAALAKGDRNTQLHEGSLKRHSSVRCSFRWKSRVFLVILYELHTWNYFLLSPFSFAYKSQDSIWTLCLPQSSQIHFSGCSIFFLHLTSRPPPPHHLHGPRVRTMLGKHSTTELHQLYRHFISKIFNTDIYLGQYTNMPCILVEDNVRESVNSIPPCRSMVSNPVY